MERYRVSAPGTAKRSPSGGSLMSCRIRHLDRSLVMQAAAILKPAVKASHDQYNVSDHISYTYKSSYGAAFHRNRAPCGGRNRVLRTRRFEQA